MVESNGGEGDDRDQKQVGERVSLVPYLGPSGSIDVVLFNVDG